MLQGFWYRFLVDAKIWEIKQLMINVETPRLASDVETPCLASEERERIVAWLREKYNING